MAPFATKAQLYTVLADRTAVDRQLDELRRSNAVRVMQVSMPQRRRVLMGRNGQVGAPNCNAAPLFCQPRH